MDISDRSLRTFPGSAILTALAVLVTVTASPLVGVVVADVPPGLVNPPNRPMQTVHAVRCQKTANKGVGKYLSTWAKTYTKCVGAIAACVQTTNSDPTCLAKAVDGCNKTIPHLGDDTEKDAGAVLEDADITSFCGSLTPTETFDDEGGPRFGLLSDPCQNRFGRSISFIQNYAGCLLEQTNCVAERLFLVQMPRARDLLEGAGVTVGHAVDAQRSCLLNESGAGALGSDPKPGKALLACEKSAGKAGVSFALKARASFAKCADAIMNCAQLKRTQKCVDSAAKTCAKKVTSVDGAQTKLASTVAKACGKIPIDDLLNDNGGNVTALTSLCAGVGVGSLATLDDYGTCLARYERCQVEDSVDFTVPRIEEFFTATQQPSAFNSSFCPTP